MLTRIQVDGRRVLCSAVSETELQEMYDEVKEQGRIEPHAPKPGDGDALFFHYEHVGPIEIRYKDRTFVLWGAPTELRFYTPEEFAELRDA